MQCGCSIGGWHLLERGTQHRGLITGDSNRFINRRVGLLGQSHHARNFHPAAMVAIRWNVEQSGLGSIKHQHFRAPQIQRHFRVCDIGVFVGAIDQSAAAIIGGEHQHVVKLLQAGGARINRIIEVRQCQICRQATGAHQLHQKQSMVFAIAVFVRHHRRRVVW